MTPAAARLLSVLTAEARGRSHPMPVRRLALRLDLAGRDVRALAAELVEAGHLVGSSCTPGRAGFFLILDENDLEEGTRHIRSRALSILRRVSALKRAAAERFSEAQVQRLFDLEREAS